ncbi:DUF6030 family protein [Ancylobacter sp. A5.8]|uniref:DUF6030 family protein n=1 Tax=Ancylobacter gelatini TaxID=2919920 RepID=UPI001F4E95FD|nr:DUF6030 family protein [Ancylobacter gelatini]MCJ8141355.1 DUF6030 family protein [Ancylobacter gelatini]
MSHPVPSPHPMQRPPSSMAGRLSVCVLFGAGCAVGALLYGVVRDELPFAAPPPVAAPRLQPSAPPVQPPPFEMTAPAPDPASAAPTVDPMVTGSARAVLPLRLALPAEAEEAPPVVAPSPLLAAPPAAAPAIALAAPASLPEPPVPVIAVPTAPMPAPMPAPASPAPASPVEAAIEDPEPPIAAPPTPAPPPVIAVAPPVEPPAPPEPVELRSPEDLCADLAAIGMHGAEWKRDSQAGEWSCTPEVERFGRDGASLFATILGIDAETVGMVRFKLNLISETVNETIKQRTVTLVNSLSKGLGLALPPEAEEALLDAAAYQFSDKNWQFVIRPQENDPARINIFLRRVPKQQIGMRGGL